MGSKKFEIKTYESFATPVVEYKKKVYDKDGIALPISPGKDNIHERGENSFSIDIHEIIGDDDSKVSIRKKMESISIELFPDWINKSVFESKLPKILNKGENPNDALALVVRLVCPQINFVIESKRVSIYDISEKKRIKFQLFNLNDVVGKVEVQSELVRIKNSNQTNPTIAFSSLTILSRNRTITFYVDEVDDIGSNALPLTPGDTKDKMFVMKNLKKLGIDPPNLIYHKQFKDFFNNGDEYKTVQTIMILVGLPYCEQLLKWIIFGMPDYEKKEHKIIIKFIGELCDKREKELEEITNEADEGKKSIEYLKLSNLVFENIQNMGSGWKKMIYQIVQNEK